METTGSILKKENVVQVARVMDKISKISVKTSLNNVRGEGRERKGKEGKERQKGREGTEAGERRKEEGGRRKKEEVRELNLCRPCPSTIFVTDQLWEDHASLTPFSLFGKTSFQNWKTWWNPLLTFS
jgi:hypothetical protein